MNELPTIINLAQALSKSFDTDVERLDIRCNYEKETTEAYLYLKGAADIAKITGYVVFHNKSSREKEEPSFVKELESEPGTAAEAMEGMKKAVDNLEVKKTPKRSESGWAGARPKDRHEKILKLYNEGWTKVKMAEELGIGISTVNYHIQKLRDEGKI